MTGGFTFNFLKPSLRRRIAFVLIAACPLVWGAVYLQGIYLTHRNVTGVYERALVLMGDTVAGVVDQWPDPERMPVALAGLEAFVDADNRVADVPHEFNLFYVWDAKGKLVQARRGADTSRSQMFGVVGFSEPAGNLRKPSSSA